MSVFEPGLYILILLGRVNTSYNNNSLKQVVITLKQLRFKLKRMDIQVKK